MSAKDMNNASHTGAEPELAGTPSDQAQDILSTGRGGITVMYVSMSRRHPDGDDAAYLRWHTLDHRPEQYRLPGVKASLRVVSTPTCRAARAASDLRLDATDHVMTYFFTDTSGLGGFNDLAVSLGKAGRMPYLLPSVQRGVFMVDSKIAAARIKVGADVLPWWPAKGIYLLVESGTLTPAALVDVPGVAGLWGASSSRSPLGNAEAGQQLTYLFLDGDPVETGERLRPVLRRRWQESDVRPLLAAPFHATVPHEWDRYLP